MTIRQPLRRKDKEITDKAEIESIIKQAEVCRIALCSDGEPYIVPMNFGYEDDILYFHSFKKGFKLDVMKKNNAVCFEADIGLKLLPAERICDWACRYKSVVGFGKAVIIEDKEEKRAALDIIIKHYTDKTFTIDEKELDKITVFKVPIDHMTGKKTGY